MATINVGKLRVNWKGAYSSSTAYEVNDAVSSGGNSYICIQAHGAGTQAVTQTAYWNVMAEGTTVLTTAGDIMTHDGSNQIRLARGTSGQVLKATSTTVAYANETGYKGWTVGTANYGDPIAWNQDPTATNAYGAAGKRAWLADYSNNWIPEYPYPNPAMGPIANAKQGMEYKQYRLNYFLNTEHELCVQGSDGNSYALNGIYGGNSHSGFILMNFSNDNGGLRDGDYFVRFWTGTHSMYALTKDGDLFSRGYNGYGQLGVGGTTNRMKWNKISTLGPDATHSGVSCQIAGFHMSNSLCSGGNSYNACYAIDTSGRLFAWGYNGYGKLGNGNTTNQSYPVHISSLSNVAMVDAGYNTCYVVDTSGNLFFAGYNQNGIDGGVGSVTAFTDTSQDDVYQILNGEGYYYTSLYAHAHYIKTDGTCYGIGGNATGIVGDGTTTQKSAWTQIGGSTKYSGMVGGGNAYYGMRATLGGTPASPNNSVYVWGYNGSGQIGIGSTTDQTSPVQPSTTSIYTHTVASTDSSTAATQTDLAFPTTSIRRIWANRGMQGQTTINMYYQDDKYRIWRSGYSNSMDYHEASTGNATISNIHMDWNPACTPQTVTTSHWASSGETKICHMNSGGNAYGSEGFESFYTEDGRCFVRGYNGQGQLDPAATYVGQWIQLRP